MRAYSQDLRVRVVQAVDGGASRRSVARAFSVSESFVIKLHQTWRRTGSTAPAGTGGGKRYALADHEALVRELVEENKDITLEELQSALAERGIRVGRSSVDRFLGHLKLTRKKRLAMPASRSARM
jgi:transposase